jgi:hypothetical protein
VVATTVRYVQKAGIAGELAEVPHDLRLALSVQVVVGAPGANNAQIYFKNCDILIKKPNLYITRRVSRLC